MTFKFGDILENGWAGDKNPRKRAIFVKMSGKDLMMTDGNGNTWLNRGDRMTKVDSITKQAEQRVAKDCIKLAEKIYEMLLLRMRKRNRSDEDGCFYAISSILNLKDKYGIKE